MGQETSKNVPRRVAAGVFASHYFVGDGIDVGAGDDCIDRHRALFPRMGAVRRWDLEDGDAQDLAGVPDASLDWVHSSHCLEHLRDPAEALRNWMRVVRPGGHVIVLVPDEDMYEQGVWPSRGNSDHKWTFTPWKAGSWSGRSLNVTDLVAGLGAEAELLRLVSLHETFDWAPGWRDQTGGAAEAAIELVLRKRPPIEIALGGRIDEARAR